MEPGFAEATSENLPEMNYIMIQEFFANNADYFSVEYRSAKNIRASRAGYGDEAVGYVQVKRDANICTVKGRIVPEHRVRDQAYRVTALFDEENDIIISCQCESCAASQGGCKHAIAFLYWILRRNDEKSPTSVECYWKKPALARIGTSVKYIKASDLKTGIPSTSCEANEFFLDKVVQAGKNVDSSAQLLNYFKEPSDIKQLSMHVLVSYYLKQTNQVNADNFLKYCEGVMTDELCALATTDTCFQSKSPAWYELRYGRITASKIFEAVCCKTKDGAFVESIFGASSMTQTSAMKRGLNLEEKVLEAVGKKLDIKFKRSGLILNKKYPALGASPDGVSDKYVVEIKCPTKKETIKNYIKPSGKLTPKSQAQIHLQMLFCKKEKGLFCIADPNFEENEKVEIHEIDFNKGVFINEVVKNAMEFWKTVIFPVLIK